MSSSALSVSDLAAKLFVQRAMESSNSPKSVLSFFFGLDFTAPSDEYKPAMRDGLPLREMQGIWYGGGNDYDKMCQAFIPTIRSVVGDRKGLREKMPDEYKLWNDSVDGIMSQVLLCDQLTRNAFRGTEEAFQYDTVGEELVRQLVDDFFQDNPQSQSVPGEIYPPYVSFMVTALMHSENVENLNLASDLLAASIQRFKDREIAMNSLKFQVGFLEDHRSIIDRFGRYPHRNSKLGRENTTEEQAWLEDKEKLPVWAKSQG
ncbi:DUF924 domain containing protein [Nitzschia inconspicua]|uniref:DUF924 domain containing protein n=1 Tax=Nitzschia inconspicua TaxID=303405 RepID=A0A9K3LHR6_9STRA|nr:DUF924 domain containing protein [Nitzschia inconspicua]